jgi:aminopeptidase N
MATPFTRWRKYDSKRSELMKTQLERILAQNGLSPNTFEIVSKSLQ